MVSEMKRIVPLLLVLMFSLSACSYLKGLLPDKKNEYKRSETMQDLEVPPDLTADAINDSMSIPGESSASLSQYRRQQARSRGGAGPSLQQYAMDEQWVGVRGTTEELWPKLRAFFSARGQGLELDDSALGVLVTDWSEPLYQGSLVYREQFKILTEAGATAGMTVLYVEQNRQERISGEEGDEWVEQDGDSGAEKRLAGELNRYFNGSQQQVVTGTPATTAGGSIGVREPTELVTDGNKKYLKIPAPYSDSWPAVGVALERTGFLIEGSNEAEGAYFISYYDSSKKKSGVLSKLKFWKGSEDEGTRYRITLNGTGVSTELVVLNEKGVWEQNEEVDRILSLLLAQLNR